MSTDATPRLRRAVLRDDERVRPLELFFDLVFVLTLTQCTALMAEHPTWQGLVQGVLIAGIMWWGWVGYSWVGSVVDPEEGMVRLGFFAAMGGLLIVALCIPHAFGDKALLFAVGYGIVRFAQLYLLSLGGRDNPDLRRSIRGLTVGTTIGVALLIGGSFADGWLQIAIWAFALLLDMGEPFVFGAEGWTLRPGHFAERHGLMIIVALGESIVAIGVGARALDLDAGIVVAALLALGISAALWWLYFDVVALVAERRLHNAAEGRERNEIARDCFSYLHFPMIAGIELMALGFEKTIEHVDEHLSLIPAVALMGGGATYLLAHVAFRWRIVHRFSLQRLVAAIVLLALIPVVQHAPALVALGMAMAVLVALLIYERLRFAELRSRLRHAA
jgi:low temperature requirement protein LtrA